MTPISITVVTHDGSTTTVPVTRDAHGFVARHDGFTIHMTAIETGRRACTPAKARLA
ncbi:hypothetical protein [Mycolicibacterium agri]|uniref:Uncharacterized protein n=1 Tax=Mycolicibacterium agri TaxID=36811 RepID=A0A7I9VW82_MYCAG|nr:hypothetical protein [Mycolicibacterium agri]GFG49457.1 hypothetical protein MAGR_08980 [Mycolicibacterium agri]